MDAIISFCTGWLELISGVFVEYPLSGAIVTAVAVGVIMFLEKDSRFKDRNRTIRNAFLVLLGWAVLVPVLGWILSVTGGFFDLILFLYKKFSEQPFVVIGILLISIVAYFLLSLFKSSVIQRPWVRGAAAALIFLILTALAVPIFSAIESGSSGTKQESEEG